MLSGVDPVNLNPIKKLTTTQSYFFTHGEDDQRMYVSHFNFIKDYANTKNIDAEFWLVPKAGHVDAMLMYPEKYGKRMKIFFEKNLKK